MNKKEIGALVFSCAVTVALLLLCRSQYPYAASACADGWPSTSIGRQGACSHHGGVVRGHDTVPWYLVVLSFGAGIGSLVILAKAFDLFVDYGDSKFAGLDFADEKENLISTAIREEMKIEFRYQKRGSHVVEERCITPQQLIFVKPGIPGSRCVVGICQRNEAARTFTLSRMSDIHISGDTSRPKPRKA